MSVDSLITNDGLPRNEEAEKTILGSIILENDLLYSVVSKITARDFYLDKNRRVFLAMQRLADQHAGIDFVTLANELRKTRELEAIGGETEIHILTDLQIRRVNLDEYINIVVEKRRLREMLTVCNNAMARAQEQNESPEKLVAETQDALMAITADMDEDDDPLIASHAVKALDRFLNNRKHTELLTGLSYGVDVLDEWTYGMQAGEVTVIGARSGVGKSALVVQSAAANARKGIPVHIFSPEMMRSQIMMRLIAGESGVAFYKLRKPMYASDDDVERVKQASMRIAEWPLRIHDKSDLHISQIAALANLSIRKYGTKAIYCDYAQIVESDGRDDKTRVSKVSRRLTKLAKDTGVPVMLASQLRKVEREYYSKPPHVGDLRETGQLENDAHIVILLHRGWDEEAKRICDDAEFIIPKMRDGQTGAPKGHFNSALAMFEGEKR